MSNQMNPVGFNANDPPLTFILKVRDAFELLTERLASIESVLVAHRMETNEGMTALHRDISDIRQRLSTNSFRDQNVEVLSQSCAQELPDEYEQLLNMPICGPSTRQNQHIEQPIQKEEINEHPSKEEEFKKLLVQDEVDEQPIQEEDEVDKQAIQEEDTIEEQSIPVEKPQIQQTKPSYMGTAARRVRTKVNVQNQDVSCSEISDEESMGDESDEADVEKAVSRASFCQSEATDLLSVNYDYGAESDDEMSSEVNQTPVHSATHLDASSHQTTPVAEESAPEKQLTETNTAKTPVFKCSTCDSTKNACECVTDEEEDDLVNVFQRNTISDPKDESSNTIVANESTELNTPLEKQDNVFKIKSTVRNELAETRISDPQSVSPQSSTPSPSKSFVTNDDPSKKAVFGKPAFGSVHKTFGSLTTEAPTFLKKLNPGENPFVINPAEHKIFPSSHAATTSTNSASPIKATNSDITRSKLAGLAPGVTGEEGEIIWLETRCRIFQFFKKDDVRERGVGNLRLLENPATNTLRCVMRREQVQKVCANFKITPNFKVATSKSGKQILTWSCLDFSDPDKPSGDPITHICRFENEETAKLFAKLVDTYSHE